MIRYRNHLLTRRITEMIFLIFMRELILLLYESVHTTFGADGKYFKRNLIFKFQYPSSTLRNSCFQVEQSSKLEEVAEEDDGTGQDFYFNFRLVAMKGSEDFCDVIKIYNISLMYILLTNHEWYKDFYREQKKSNWRKQHIRVQSLKRNRTIQPDFPAYRFCNGDGDNVSGCSRGASPNLNRIGIERKKCILCGRADADFAWIKVSAGIQWRGPTVPLLRNPRDPASITNTQRREEGSWMTIRTRQIDPRSRENDRRHPFHPYRTPVHPPMHRDFHRQWIRIIGRRNGNGYQV